MSEHEFELKQYQRNGINDMVRYTERILNRGKTAAIVVKCPTGGGKTYMAARFVEELANNLYDKSTSFFWVSPGTGGLHIQSYIALSNMLNGFPKCSLLSNDGRKEIEENEILIADWESIINEKNLLRRKGEQLNLSEILDNTRAAGRKLILIIDESHRNLHTEKSIYTLEEIIKPDVIVELSATPLMGSKGNSNSHSYWIPIEFDEVIEEGMIKKEVIINYGLSDIDKLDDKTSQEVVLEAALAKAVEIREHYKQRGLSINPLILVQIPNSKAGDIKKQFTEEFLTTKGITEENAKLAIWLSEEKSDHLKGIDNFNSPVEVLLFKQAIALGWDCPRAHILVVYRSTKSEPFRIQTVGRILRMPERKHYGIEALDCGFVFSDLTEVIIDKDTYTPTRIKDRRSVKRPECKMVPIKSYYKQRVVQGDIGRSFRPVLQEIFSKSLDLDPMDKDANREKMVKAGFIMDTDAHKEFVIENTSILTGILDKMRSECIRSSDKILLKLSESDTLAVFDNCIKECLRGFASARSIPTVRMAIYKWFEGYFGIDPRGTGTIEIQSIFISNYEKFGPLLEETVECYKPIRNEEDERRSEERYYEWEIVGSESKDDYFSSEQYEPITYQLYAMRPCYLKRERPKTEYEFEQYLELSNNIEWWYKNGDRGEKYFSIKYTDINNKDRMFYPDYFIKLKSGALCIFDTKSGQTASSSDTTKKAESLQKFIAENSCKDQELMGGIVINDGESWRINKEANYKYDPDNLSSWEYLSKII